MKHRYSLEGYGYRLRPIRKSDAAFILKVRLEDIERNRYIHAVPNDISVQEAWLERYFQRPGDYYFVVENRVTGEGEGLIAFYNEADGRAEWGRWVLRKGSLAASESVWLLYRIAFEQVGLDELYCRTISDNTAVVAFHDSIGEITRQILPHAASLDGQWYDETEQFSDKKHFYEVIAPALERQARRVYHRNLRGALGGFEFHHIGVATRSIEKELPIYTLLGYEPEGECFEDELQGIRGLFLTAKNQPRLELLENLEGSHTLDTPLASGQKYYHLAYRTPNIEQAAEILTGNRAKVMSGMKQSSYFGKRICFLMLPNMSMVELVEA